MRVCVVVELDVGETPVADAISYFIAHRSVAPGDDDPTTAEWVEAVIRDTIEQLHLQPGVEHWNVITFHTMTPN